MTYPAGDPRLIDVAALTDFMRCPSCGVALASARCSACGVDLSGADGQRLRDLSVQAARVLGERRSLIETLRQRSRSAPATPVAAPLVPPSTAAPAPPVVPLPPAPPGSPVVARREPRIGVQGLLVGLGALLLGVAVVVFLAFSWTVLGLTGRSLVVAALTIAVMAVAARLRLRLPSTGEAVGGLAVLLVLADAWAVRHTGLVGPEDASGPVYAAAAAAVSAAILAGWGLLTGVRAGSIAASALTPAAAFLAGVAWADAAGDARPAILGALAGAAIAAVRERLPADLDIERLTLRVFAAGLLALAVAGATLLLPEQQAGSAAGLLVLAAAVAAVVGWPTAAGAVAGVAGCLAGYWASGGLPADRTWAIGLAPAFAGAIAVGARRRPGYARGAGAVAVLAGVPAAVAALLQLVAAASAAIPAWRWSVGTTLADASADVAASLDLPGHQPHLWAASVLGLAATTAAALVAAPPARGLARRAGVAAASAAVVLAPLAPELPLGVAIGLLLAATVLAVWEPARTPAVAAGAAGVVLAWSVDVVSVPATAAGVAGLLLARALVADEDRRAALAAMATVSSAVATGAAAGLAGRSVADRITAAGLAGGLICAAAALVPPPRGASVRDRSAVTVAGAVVLAIAIAIAVAVSGDLPVQAGRVAALLVAATVAAVACAAAPSLGVRAGLNVPAAAVAAAAVPPLTAGAAFAVHAASAPAEWDAPAAPVLAAAAAVVAAGLAVAVTAPPPRARVRDARRVAAEGGLVGVGLLAAAAQIEPPGDTRPWVLLLLLGVAAAAVAVTPDRSRVGWLAGVLLTGSTWSRLADAGVRVVEAYTLAPAAALAVLAALRLWRDPALARSRAALLRLLGPVATVGVLPSVLACRSGPDMRPAAMIGMGAALTAAATRLPRRAAIPALGFAALAAGGAGAVRALSVAQVEVWSLPSAAVLLAAGLLAMRARLTVGSLPADVSLVPAWCLAAGPSLAAAARPGDAHASVRAGAVLAVAVAAALTPAWRWPAARATIVTVTGLAMAATVIGLALDTGPVEAWTGPLAVLLAGLGVRALADDPRLGSWAALGPGIALGLLPSLALSTDRLDAVRVVGLALAATAVVAAGAAYRLQAPLVGGATVLVAHALVQLGPWLARTYQAVPRWLGLAVLGLALLAVGATYERRLTQLRAVRLRLSALR